MGCFWVLKRAARICRQETFQPDTVTTFQHFNAYSKGIGKDKVAAHEVGVASGRCQRKFLLCLQSPERSSCNIFVRGRRKMQRNIGEMFRRFSSFYFQENGPKKIHEKSSTSSTLHQRKFFLSQQLWGLEGPSSCESSELSGFPEKMGRKNDQETYRNSAGHCEVDKRL